MEMKDPRVRKLAELLVNYSTKVKENDKVMVAAVDPAAYPLVEEIIELVGKKGAHAFVTLNAQAVQRKLYMHATDTMLDIMRESELAFAQKMDAYIGIRALENKFETNDVPQKQMMKIMQNYRMKVSNEIMSKKWVTLMFPTPGFAQASNMSMEAFEEFFFNVTTLDYAKMDRAMDPFKQLLEKTDKVHIKGPGRTDITLSIKGLPAIKCAGEYNIPDGEIFTAPVKDSINGVIEYNTPSIYLGTKFDKVILTFENGKIVKHEGSNPEKLEEIFNADAGAKYVGEFAFGVNPYIVEPTINILFDEKISGSIHLTPGRAYGECNNGNDSSIHWDLVMIQTPEYGGGEIYFDGILVRKDGRFVLPELAGLNPENLK
jgi:aminopeptidase